MRPRPKLPRRIARSVTPGSRVEVLEGPRRVGGSLVAETRNTILVEEKESGKIIKLPKDQVVIMVDGELVVPGPALVGDPAERLVKSYER